MLKYLFLLILFTIAAPQPAFTAQPSDLSLHTTKPTDDNPKKHDALSVLALVVLFLVPYLGIHRVMMGGSYWLIVGYIVSFGGFFGLLPLMDFFRILLEPEHYRKNNKFMAAFGFY